MKSPSLENKMSLTGWVRPVI